MFDKKKLLLRTVTLTLVTGIFSGVNVEVSMANGNHVIINREIYDSVYGNSSNSEHSYTGRDLNGASYNVIDLNSNAKVKEAWGGYSIESDASYNVLNLNGGTVYENICAGYSEYGNTNNNITNFNSGTVVERYIDGGWSNYGNANNNVVNLNGGVAKSGVIIWAGYTVVGNTNNNTINLNGTEVNDSVLCGNVVKEGHANSNTVNMNKGVVNGNIYSGYSGNYYDEISGKVSADSNHVNVSGGIVNGSIYGGYAPSGRANNNSVSVSGGIVNGSIYVGTGKEARNNNVNWYGGNINGEIVGDSVDSWNGDSNSTFKFFASSSNSDKNILGIRNFKNYNFIIGNSIIPNTNLITSANKVDLSKSNIGITLSANPTIVKGDNVILFNSLNGILTKNDSEVVYGENIYDIYEINLNNDGHSLKATLGDVIGPNTKNEEISSSRQPEVALIDDKLDIVDTAYNMSVGKSEPVVYFDFNYSDVKKGDLTMRGNDNVIGSATTKGDEAKKNTITQGPFVEYGDGTFGGKNFYSTGGVEGSGKNKKYGAGYLFRQVKFGKHHFDAYLRAGKINNEFRSFMQGVGNVDYDNSDVYYAAHFGYGQYMPIDPHTKMDVYGKYFYKILPGSSTTTHVSTGGDINTEFDALTSHKFRIGSKITWDYMEEKKKMMFADLALEHELSHTQTSKLGDRVISNSSGADTTAVMEIGYRQVFGPKDAFLFTADLQGYAGTRTGFGGNIGVRFNF